MYILDKMPDFSRLKHKKNNKTKSIYDSKVSEFNAFYNFTVNNGLYDKSVYDIAKLFIKSINDGEIYTFPSDDFLLVKFSKKIKWEILLRSYMTVMNVGMKDINNMRVIDVLKEVYEIEQ